MNIINLKDHEPLGKNLMPDIYEKSSRKNHQTKFIYFIESENGLVKIGTSYNVKQRFHNLQSTSPLRLKLLFFKRGSVKKEREIHQQFSHIRHHGEWFENTDELKTYLEMLNPALKPVEIITKEETNKNVDFLKKEYGRWEDVAHELGYKPRNLRRLRETGRYPLWFKKHVRLHIKFLIFKKL